MDLNFHEVQGTPPMVQPGGLVKQSITIRIYI